MICPMPDTCPFAAAPNQFHVRVARRGAWQGGKSAKCPFFTKSAPMASTVSHRHPGVALPWAGTHRTPHPHLEFLCQTPPAPFNRAGSAIFMHFLQCPITTRVSGIWVDTRVPWDSRANAAKWPTQSPIQLPVGFRAAVPLPHMSQARCSHLRAPCL